MSKGNLMGTDPMIEKQQSDQEESVFSEGF
jgi:hypothetical protein